ncbi:hypothetical protein [Roseibium marinum]|nr:hypothetical protein [Roseibium marinum]
MKQDLSCPVFPWLDPGIHAATLPSIQSVQIWQGYGMDCRIRSCNDEAEV